MGLSLTVGILADLREHDEDGAQWTRDAFKVANAVLADHGVERHRDRRIASHGSQIAGGIMAYMHCARLPPLSGGARRFRVHGF